MYFHMIIHLSMMGPSWLNSSMMAITVVVAKSMVSPASNPAMVRFFQSALTRRVAVSHWPQCFNVLSVTGPPVVLPFVVSRLESRLGVSSMERCPPKREPEDVKTLPGYWKKLLLTVFYRCLVL